MECLLTFLGLKILSNLEEMKSVELASPDLRNNFLLFSQDPGPREKGSGVQEEEREDRS